MKEETKKALDLIKLKLDRDSHAYLLGLNQTSEEKENTEMLTIIEDEISKLDTSEGILRNRLLARITKLTFQMSICDTVISKSRGLTRKVAVETKADYAEVQKVLIELLGAQYAL